MRALRFRVALPSRVRRLDAGCFFRHMGRMHVQQGVWMRIWLMELVFRVAETPGREQA
jgi:hypothetical protein